MKSRTQEALSKETASEDLEEGGSWPVGIWEKRSILGSGPGALLLNLRNTKRASVVRVVRTKG